MKTRNLRLLTRPATPMFYLPKALSITIFSLYSSFLFGQCTNTSAYPSTGIDAPSSGTVTISSCQYQSEYCTINNIMNQNTYTSTYDLGGYVTVRSGTFDGPVVKQGSSPLTWTATSTGTHYIHWTTDASCGQATSCGVSTIEFVSSGSGTTPFVPSSGSNSYLLCSGSITDHMLTNDYSSSCDGYSTIYPGTPGQMVQLSGTIDTEINYDYVYVYDGETPSSTLLYQGSGSESIGILTASNISGALTVRFTSDVSVQYPGFDLTIACASACTGTPNSGSIAISASTGCPNESVTLTGTGLSTSAFMTYQWMSSSSSNGTYSNISGETSTTLTTAPSLTTYYKLKSTCTNSSLSSESNIEMRDVSSLSGTSGYTCGTGSVTLNASASSGNVEWYTDISGGTSISTGNSFNTGSISQSTTYYAASSNCPSYRTGITATVKATPSVDAGSPASFCAGGNTQLNGSITGTNDNGSIGNGTSGFYQSPLNRFYDYSCSEMIYLQTEIGKSGPINTLSFNKFSGDNSVVISDITVYMKHSTASSFVDGTTSIAGYTQVYSGSFPNNALGWNEITLTTPFNYDNINNLQILVVKGYEAYTSDRPYYKYTNSSPTNMIRMYYSDYDEWSSSQTLTADSWRPDIQFSIGNSVTQAWTPATGLDDPSSLTPTSTASTTTTYTLEATSSNGCVVTSPVTITVNALPTINVTPAAACGNSTIGLSATASSGTSVEWYNNSTGGTSINTGSNFTTPLLNASTTYYTSTTDANGCTTSPREEITATINTIPAADAGTDKNGLTMCGLETVNMNAVLESGFSGEWTILSGVNILANDITDPTTEINPASYGGNTELQWEVTNQSTGCSNTAIVNVEFLQPNTNSISNPQTGDFLWNGMTDSDWSGNSNWYEYQAGGYWKMMNSGEPSTSDPVYIMSSVDGGTCISSSNNPTPANNENVNDLNIMTGATLNLNSGSKLIIQGNLNNNGSIISGANSRIIMNGSSDQSINGNQTTLYELKINKTSGDLLINTPVVVSNELNMTSGDIINSSLLCLGESSSKYGTLVYSDGIIKGAFRRYFPTSASSNFLFPIGKDSYKRETSISFPSSPGNDQYLTMEFITGAPGSGSGLYNGLPLTTQDGQLIQQYSNEGYWQIDPTNNDYSSSINSSPYSIKIHAKSVSGVMDRNTIRIIKSPGPSHDTWIECGNYALTTGSSNDDFYITSDNAIGFSFFGLGGDNDNPLPVDLISFSANCNNENIDLHWSTATEHNSDYFMIEKSSNAINWREVHMVNAAGNSTEKLNYHVTDNDPSYSEYYRLSQYDFDGSVHSQETIRINCSSSNNLNISSYPNPSNNKFNLMIENNELIENSLIRIVDSRGSEVYQKIESINDGTTLIKIEHVNLKPGVYTILIEGNNNKIIRKKHIVQ